MRFLVLSLCTLTAPIFGHMIGNMEYQMPKSAENWQICNKIDNEHGKIIVYSPEKSAPDQEITEFFGVNVNSFPADFENTKLIKGELSKLYSGAEVDIAVIEKNKDSVIYEWNAKEKGIEFVHGWGRVLSTKEGTGIVSYQTNNIAAVPEARTVWLPVLNQVKIIAKN